MTRAFVALDLPPETEDAIQGLQQALTAYRPTPADNLHLTLVFLDDQPDDVLEDLHDRLAALRPPAISLTLGGGDLMGRGGQVLALRTQNTPEMTALQAEVARAARKSGIHPEARRFLPHVTIARPRAPDAPAALAKLTAALPPEVRLAPATAPSFSLFGSVLHPTGARHEALATYPLPLA